MSNRKLCTGSAVLACLTLVGTVTAAPTFKVLYHERLDITPRVDINGQQRVSFDAYGRHFDIELELNDNIARGVSADRPDIKPYRGTVEGQAGSWVRLTSSRDGWRGVVSDGQDIYAIEPASEMKQIAVQPLPAGASSSMPIMYRLGDAIMPDGAGVCGTDTTAAASFSGAGRSSAQNAFTRLAADLSKKDTTGIATRQLTVNVVADHTFTEAIGSDPEGAIVARWDIVDGIWSSQVGIRIVLAPITILTAIDDPFSSTTSAATLLAEVSGYRAGLPAHEETALTHLATGRVMDGHIIGISYLGAICDGAQAVSLSQSTTSLIMGGLIAAHELGHSFNAVHDGVPGACSTTPLTYLMAPTINFSNQFSACSLQSINVRAATASCLRQTAPVISSNPTTGSSGSSGTISDPGTTNSGGGNTGGMGSSAGASGASSGGGGGTLDLCWIGFLGSMLLLRRACTRLPRRHGH
ncbi:MAG TPA: M12 family metallo-peptidase [Steroidobacteraceae bacterium]